MFPFHFSPPKRKKIMRKIIIPLIKGITNACILITLSRITYNTLEAYNMVDSNNIYTFRNFISVVGGCTIAIKIFEKIKY
jgi:hypothetical protein